jgi:hypothetical protein
MRQFKRTLAKIRRLKPGQTGKLPWLLGELTNESPAIRSAAVSALYQKFNSAEYEQIFLTMLDSESDQDVLIPLMYSLAGSRQGSRDLNLARRYVRAVNRFKPCLSGTREALADALLRVMDNLDSVAVFKMSAEERARRVAVIWSELNE